MKKKCLKSILIINLLLSAIAYSDSQNQLTGFPGDTLTIYSKSAVSVRYCLFQRDTLQFTATEESGISFIVPDKAPGDYTFTAIDKNGDTSSVKTILIMNNPPRWSRTPDTIIFNEDTSFRLPLESLRMIAFDRDSGATLKFSANSGDHLNISQDSLAFTIRADKDWNGESEIILTVCDGELSSAVTVPVKILPVNDPPVLTAPEHTSGLEDELMRFSFESIDKLVSDIDTPPDSLKWRFIHGEHIMISPESDSLIVIGEKNWFGLDTLQIIASDGEYTDTVNWTFKLISVNDPPELNKLEPMHFYEDDTLNISREFFSHFSRDIETPTENLKWQMEPYGEIQTVYDGNSLSCYADENWFGTDSIRVTVSDGELTAFRNLIINVISVNDVPVIQSYPVQTFREDDTLFLSHRYMGRYVHDVETSDKDLDWKFTGSQHVHVKNLKHNIMIHADRNWYGRSIISLKVSDGELSAERKIRIKVNAVNDKPTVISPPEKTFKEDDTLFVPLKDIVTYAYDVETKNTDLIWSIMGTKYMHSFNKNDIFRIYADPDWYGRDTVNLIVSDGGLSDTARWGMTVESVNDAPRFKALPDTFITEDDLLYMPKKILTDLVSDPDEGDNVNIWLHGSENISVEARNDTFIIWPYADWYGNENLIFGATDGIIRDSVKWNMPVISVNDAPYFTIYLPDSISFRADKADTMFLKDVVYDIDNKQSDLIWDVRPGKNVRCIVNDKLNAIIFHTENFAYGEDAVTLTVTDGENIIEHYMPVYVHEVNRFLAAKPQSLELYPNSPNPFKRHTIITYSLPVDGHVSLKIYNILGEEVKTIITEYQEARNYRYVWYGEDRNGGLVPSGVYLCRLVAQIEGETMVKMHKMMLVR